MRGQIVHIRGESEGEEGLWANGYYVVRSAPFLGDLPHEERDYIYAMWCSAGTTEYPYFPVFNNCVGYNVTMWPAGGHAWIAELIWDGVTPASSCAVWIEPGSEEQPPIPGLTMHLIDPACWRGIFPEEG